MKIVGVSMVRNEADIVEAFVRHNLTYLDGMVVVDHVSADATPDILMALCRERLPLVVLRNETVGYLQHAVMTQVVRQAFASTGADFVFPLDADEFLKVRSRQALEGALRALPPGVHGSFAWQTYVPDDLGRASPGILETLRAVKRVRHPRLRQVKAAIARTFLDAKDDVLVSGSHYVGPHPDAADQSKRPRVRIDDRVAALAHVPIRSADQFIVKVATKKLGRVAANMDWEANAASQAAYGVLRSGRPLDPAWLRHVSINWIVWEELWLDEKELSILPDPFLAPISLRYTPPRAADALPLMLAATERMTRRLADTRASVGTGSPAPS